MFSVLSLYFIIRCQMQSEEDCKLKLQKLEDYVHELQSSKVSVI